MNAPIRTDAITGLKIFSTRAAKATDKITGKGYSEIDDQALASYLMYPKVFTDFARAQETYGPVSVLPTPVFFYGLPIGEEIFVELEKGIDSAVQVLTAGRWQNADDRTIIFIFYFQ